MSQVVGKGEVYRAHRPIEAYLLGVCSGKMHKSLK